MTTDKPKVVAYIGDTTSSELKNISKNTKVSRSKLLGHSLDSLVFKARMLQRYGLIGATSRIIESYGGKLSIGGHGETIVRDIDNVEAFRIDLTDVKTPTEVVKRVLNTYDKTTAEIVQGDRKGTAIVYALPMIAMDVKICCEKE